MAAELERPRVVILAAGASSRLGQPKALVDLPGGRPIVRLCEAAHAAKDVKPLVVTGAHAPEIREALEDSGLPQASYELLEHERWRSGRTSSLIAAARLREGCDLCVLPVDHPRISGALLARLFGAWLAQGAPATGWLAPGLERDGTDSPRPGHPVLIGRQLIGELLAAPTSWAGRPLMHLRRAAAPLWLLATRDAAVLENLDRPEDLERIRQLDRPTEAGP